MSPARAYLARSPRLQAGLTLIEALIAALILAIGILGVVSLLAMSKTSQHEGIQRTRAISLADDMMERIRRNPAGVATYDRGLATPLGGSTFTSQPTADCVSSSCTSAERANQDLWAWEQLLDGAAATEIIEGGAVNTARLREVVACIDFTADLGKTSTGVVNIVIQWEGLQESFDAIAGGGITCGDDSDAGVSRRQIVLSSYIVDETE